MMMLSTFFWGIRTCKNHYSSSGVELQVTHTATRTKTLTKSGRRSSRDVARTSAPYLSAYALERRAVGALSPFIGRPVFVGWRDARRRLNGEISLPLARFRLPPPI